MFAIVSTTNSYIFVYYLLLIAIHPLLISVCYLVMIKYISVCYLLLIAIHKCLLSTFCYLLLITMHKCLLSTAISFNLLHKINIPDIIILLHQITLLLIRYTTQHLLVIAYIHLCACYLLLITIH